MPDTFADFLERHDIVFQDFESAGQLALRLTQVLGHAPIGGQLPAAIVVLQTQRQQAIMLGFTVDRFVRRGQQVTQLRDARGRFVASGARDIAARLAQASG